MKKCLIVHSIVLWDGNMELEKIIKHRKSIRKYKVDDVSKDMVEKLIDCARYAPSAKNRQPWEFVVVKDKMKDDIANIMLKKEKETNGKLERKIYKYKSSVKQTAFIIKNAPILILVFRPKEDNWLIGDSLSIGAAIEHICLKSVEMGLGTLWIRDIVYTQEEIANLLNYGNKSLISAIALGYPDEIPKLRIRKKLNEILRWY